MTNNNLQKILKVDSDYNKFTVLISTEESNQSDYRTGKNLFT